MCLPVIPATAFAATEWSEAVMGVNGDTVNYRIEVRNTGEAMLNNVLVRATLPSGLQYIDGSTEVCNINNKDGVTISDNIVTNTGINIGNYAHSSNAWIYFSATVAIEENQSNKNRILRSMVEISGGRDTNNSAIVDVAVKATDQ